MKPRYIVVALFITASAISIGMPLHARAKDAEHTTKTLQQLKETLPSKVKGKTEQIQQKAEELRTKYEQKAQEQTQQQSLENTPQPQAITPQTTQLSETKKKLCLANKVSINDVIKKVTTERQQAYEQISKISESAQRFYAAHTLSIAHYDSLVVAVERSSQAAQQTLDIQKSMPLFDCNTPSPRALIEDFRTKSEASREAARLYKEAVKALLVTVRDTYKISKNTSGDAS